MRVLASAASRRDDAAVGVPMAVQFVPLLVEKNQLPWAVSAAVTAIPVTTLSMSVTLSSPPAGGFRSTRLETGVPTAPLGAPGSSLIVVNVGEALASSTGASFTG